MNVFTHGDFDGIVSAALVELCLGKARFLFASPKTIAAQEVTEADVVCDLPYPHRRARYWFDHHEGNIETVQRLGLADQIAGRFVPAPSAAQVVYDFFRESHPFRAFIPETVREANRIDSMDYATVEEWLEPTPAHRINRAIFQPNERFPDARRFMLLLARTVGRFPLSEIAESEEVERRYAVARRHEEESVDLIRKVGTMLEPGGEILLLDFSEHRVAPSFSKNMAYTVFPQARGILQLFPGFEGGARANAIRLSLSLNPFGPKDLRHSAAAIFEALGIGSGHPGAAGGGISADSKQQLLARKEQALVEIATRWRAQGEAPHAGESSSG